MEREDPGSPSGSSWSRLWGELRRRRVVRTTLLYLGGAVAVVEGADAFADPLGLPAEAIRALAIVLASGLPLVAALAWAYDVNATADSEADRRGTVRRGLVLAAMASVSLGLAYGLWTRDGRPEVPPPAAPSTSNRIAVLPFDAPGASEELRVLSEHLHGRLIDGLSEALAPAGLPDSERVRVVSRLGVQALAAGGATVDSIVRALDVGTLIEGSLEIVPDSVRIRLRLVDAATADQIDSRIATAPLDDPVALADDLGQTVLEMLQRRLGELVRDRARRMETRSPEAFRSLVLAEAERGEFQGAMVRRDLEGAEASLERADSLFADAARLDPSWVEPWVARGMATDDHAAFATATDRRGELAVLYRRGLAFADSALRRAPGDHRALHLRGMMRLRLAAFAPTPDSAAGILEVAEDDLRAAARGSPTPAQPLRMLSELFAESGRLEEALAFGAQAYEEDRYLQDVDVTLLRLFQYSLQLDRDEEAARYCAEGRRRFDRPHFEDCHLVLMAWSDEVDPVPDSAWAAVARELAVYPAPLRPRLEPRLHALVAATLAQSNRADSARAVLDRALSAAEMNVGLGLAAAGAFALLGDVDRALDQLDRLVAEGTPPADLIRAPELRPLRGTSAYRALAGNR